MHEPAASLIVPMLRESLSQGGQPSLTVTSRSMAPMLNPGDQIALEPVTAAQLRPGDIVTMAGSDHLMTHRFWGTLEQPARLITKGDRAAVPDAPWRVDCLIGRVASRSRNGRTWSLHSGAGQWLNRRQTSLARLELKACGAWNDTQPLLDVPLSRSSSLRCRLLRRAFTLFAQAAALLARLAQ